MSALRYGGLTPATWRADVMRLLSWTEDAEQLCDAILAAADRDDDGFLDDESCADIADDVLMAVEEVDTPEGDCRALRRAVQAAWDAIPTGGGRR